MMAKNIRIRMSNMVFVGRTWRTPQVPVQKLIGLGPLIMNEDFRKGSGIAGAEDISQLRAPLPSRCALGF